MFVRCLYIYADANRPHRRDKYGNFCILTKSLLFVYALKKQKPTNCMCVGLYRDVLKLFLALKAAIKGSKSLRCLQIGQNGKYFAI